MVTHRLIEVHGRTGRSVEPGHPHGAHEHQPERVHGVLEPGIEVLVVHLPAVRSDVQAEFGHVGHLALGLGHHHGPFGSAHELDLGFQVWTLQRWCVHQLGFELRQLVVPAFVDQVVHTHGGRLVDRHVHGFTGEATVHEVFDHVVGDRFEAFKTGDQVVLAAELAGHGLLLVGIQGCFVQQRFELGIEVLVGELQFGDPVLVVERNRCLVDDRVSEVVDRHVVAEHLPGEFLLVVDQRRAGEPEERGVRQRGAHVHRQRVVLGAVRLVGDHHDVVTIRQHRHLRVRLGRNELVDQSEHVPVVDAQQFPEMCRRFGVHVRSGRDGIGIDERLVQLVVEFLTVGDHHERPVTRHRSQHLLGEPQHRQALARPLGVPEHPEPAVALLGFPDGVDGVVHAEELVVLGQGLDQTARHLHVGDKICQQVQNPVGGTRRPQGRFERHEALFTLVVDLLPLGEVLPPRIGGTHLGVRPVGQHHEPV